MVDSKAVALLGVVAVVIAGVLIFVFASSEPGCEPVSADFTSEAAAGDLTRMNDRGGKSTYDFVEHRLEMNAQPGTDAPYMYRTVQGDFTVEAELFADPSTRGQAAGLQLVKDAQNTIKLERGHGDVIAFEHNQNRVETRLDAHNVALRLIRKGELVSAEWRDIPNNGEWRPLGVPAPLTEVVRVGITTSTGSAEPFSAAFRYLRTTCS